MSLTPITYEAVRNEYVLVRHEPERHALLALLRVEGAESGDTSARLREAGLTPECAVSWRLDADDTDGGLRRIHGALGDDAIFDAGTSFDVASAERLQANLPRAWPGRFLLHVGGTHRCLILDRAAPLPDLAKAFHAAEAAYFAADYHPLTE